MISAKIYIRVFVLNSMWRNIVKKITCCLFALMTFTVLAESKYMMPTLVLKDALKESIPPHCEANSDRNLSSKKNLRRTSLQVEIDCKIKCKTKDLSSIRLSDQIFDVHRLGLPKGDGDLWASTTTALVYWGQEACLKLASSKCGTLQDIDQFKMEKMTSGDWSFDGVAGCGKKQTEIFSPFDQKIKVGEVFESIISQQPNITTSQLRFNWDRSFDGHSFNRKEQEASSKSKSCSKYIEGVFCYGDCVTLDQKVSNELLASPGPLGSKTVKICADEYFESIKNLLLSKSVRKHLCETFFLSEIKRLDLIGLSCASSRFDVNCSGL